MIPTPYKIGASVLAVLGFAALCGWGGYSYRAAECDATVSAIKQEIAEARELSAMRALRITELQDEVASREGRIYETRRQLEEAQARVVVKEVIKYVQSPDAGRCELPADWVLIDTAAAAGVSAATVSAASSPDAARGFTDTDALATSVERSHVCRAEIDKLRLWQDWWQGIQRERENALQDTQ